MKSVASIVNALRKEESVTIVENVTLVGAHVGAVSNGRCTIALRTGKPVIGMIPVTDELKAKLQAAVDDAEAAVAAADKDSKATAEAALADANLKLEEANKNDYVVGETDVIFTSNYEVMALLRQNPETRFLAKLVDKMPEIVEDLLNEGSVNVICQRVVAGEQYSNPFSEQNKTVLVKNNSVFHNLFQLVMSRFGISYAKQLRKMQMQIMMKEMMKKMSSKSTSALDDDDDDDTDD